MAKHGFVKVVVLGGAVEVLGGAVEVRWRCGCKYVNEVGVLGGALFEVHCLICAGGAVGVRWRCSWGALEVQLRCAGGAVGVRWRCS